MTAHHRINAQQFALRLGIALLGVVVAGCGGNTGTSPSAPAAAPSPAAYQIMAAVEQPTEMDYVDTPLSDVVESLAARHGIKIELDEKSLAGVGINRDTTITCQVKGLSLSAALAEILQPRKLTYVIDHGAMVITTAAKARQMGR